MRYSAYQFSMGNFVTTKVSAQTAMAMAMAIASVEMEGLAVTAEDRELLSRVVAGELTSTEAMQQVLQEARRASNAS